MKPRHCAADGAFASSIGRSTQPVLRTGGLVALSNKVLAAEYRTALPDEEVLAAELDRTRQLLATAKPGSKR